MDGHDEHEANRTPSISGDADMPSPSGGHEVAYAGAFAGAALGAVGTFLLPGPGTVAGVLIGTAVGTAGGAFVGSQFDD